MRPNQNPVTVKVSRKELCDVLLALDAVGAFWGDIRDSLREREFFLLFYFEGCNMRTVCERLFITKSTGYNTMRRIRKKAEGVRMGL